MQAFLLYSLKCLCRAEELGCLHPNREQDFVDQVRPHADKYNENMFKSVQNECRRKMLAFFYDRGAAADAIGVNLEFTLKDSLGRDWQCGTIQVDFNLPMRLGAEYVGKDNQ